MWGLKFGGVSVHVTILKSLYDLGCGFCACLSLFMCVNLTVTPRIKKRQKKRSHENISLTPYWIIPEQRFLGRFSSRLLRIYDSKNNFSQSAGVVFNWHLVEGLKICCKWLMSQLGAVNYEWGTAGRKSESCFNQIQLISSNKWKGVSYRIF